VKPPGGNLARSGLRRGETRLARTGYSSFAPRQPRSNAVPLLAGETQGKGKSAARTKCGSGTGETFPPAVAALIDARDPWCVHCGSPDNLHRHHRRIKGIGGDPREHTHCACDGLRLCSACHEWAHTTGRREAEAEGLIIPRATLEPWTVSVLVHLADGGVRKFPTCDGRWVDDLSEVAA
jgi:hypothetical protein